MLSKLALHLCVFLEDAVGCWAAGLPLLFVLVKQRRHVGRGTDGGVIRKEKHEQQ